jgi:mRNA interferase RelE/StbE
VKVQVEREVLVWPHKQPRGVFLVVLGAVLGLVADPSPQNSTEMRDGSGRRLRVGDYRVLYRLDGDELSIHAVGHRKDVYDG